MNKWKWMAKSEKVAMFSTFGFILVPLIMGVAYKEIRNVKSEREIRISELENAPDIREYHRLRNQQTDSNLGYALMQGVIGAGLSGGLVYAISSYQDSKKSKRLE